MYKKIFGLIGFSLLMPNIMAMDNEEQEFRQNPPIIHIVNLTENSCLFDLSTQASFEMYVEESWDQDQLSQELRRYLNLTNSQDPSTTILDSIAGDFAGGRVETFTFNSTLNIQEIGPREFIEQELLTDDLMLAILRTHGDLPETRCSFNFTIRAGQGRLPTDPQQLELLESYIPMARSLGQNLEINNLPSTYNSLEDTNRNIANLLVNTLPGFSIVLNAPNPLSIVDIMQNIIDITDEGLSQRAIPHSDDDVDTNDSTSNDSDNDDSSSNSDNDEDNPMNYDIGID